MHPYLLFGQWPYYLTDSIIWTCIFPDYPVYNGSLFVALFRVLCTFVFCNTGCCICHWCKSRRNLEDDIPCTPIVPVVICFGDLVGDCPKPCSSLAGRHTQLKRQVAPCSSLFYQHTQMKWWTAPCSSLVWWHSWLKWLIASGSSLVWRCVMGLLKWLRVTEHLLNLTLLLH